MATISRRGLSLALALALAPALSAQQVADDGARAISLDEAVKLAQQNAPAVLQARNQGRTSQAQVRGAISSFIPSLNLNANGSQSGGETFFQGQLVPYRGDAWSYSKGFSSNVMLFDAGQRWYNLKSARANVSAADASELSQRFLVAFSVKQQYFAVLAARESEAAARRQMEQAEQQFKVSSAKVTAGSATRSDSLRATIQVTTARLNILTAQNNLRIANAALTRLVASSVVVTAVAADTAETGKVLLDSTSLTKLAEEGPAVRQAAAQLSAGHAVRRAASTPYYPTLSASYSYNGNNSSKTFTWGGGPYAESNRLSFNISYPLFNQWQRELQVAQATATEDNAEAAYRDAKFAAQAALVTQLSAFRLAEQKIALQLDQIASAEEDLRVQQQRYTLGASTLLDVLTSQTALDNARVALIQARFDARTAKAQIEAIIGLDLR